MVANDAKSSFQVLVVRYQQTKSQADFANVMLHAWILVELYVNRLYLKGLGLSPDTTIPAVYDNLIDALENASFETKRQFLVKNKTFNKKEAKAIQEFQYERNRLFHASKKNDVLSKLFLRHLQEPLVEKAEAGFLAVWMAVGRAYGIKLG